MARTWQYPRWRRLLMQAAMWIVLGATIGLAALVDREKAAGRAVAMGPSLVLGGVSLKVPAGWRVSNQTTEWGMLNATEPSRRDGQRILYITATNHWDDGDIEQLLRQGMESGHAHKPAPDKDVPDDNSTSTGQLRTYQMTPRNYPQQSLAFGSGSLSTTGPLLVQDRTVEDDNGDEAVLFRQVIATAALPAGKDAGTQLTLRLVHLTTGGRDIGQVQNDLELVTQVAATVMPAVK